MDTRKAKMVANKGGRGGTTFRATLPTTWVRAMGLSEECRDLLLEFDGDKIMVKNNKSYKSKHK